MKRGKKESKKGRVKTEKGMSGEGGDRQRERLVGKGKSREGEK